MRLSPRLRLWPAAALLLAVSPALAVNISRTAHTATLLSNGNLLIAGGVTATGVTNSVEIIATGANLGPGNVDIFATSMNVARASHTATFMPNGKVLVAGGIGSGGTALNSLEIYDPSANTWTLLGATLSNARYNHTATLLQDGRVLICGGQDQTGATWTSCDAYNSATGVLTTNVSALQQARALHTASLLKDGRVWFAGGWNNSSGYLSTTEIFTPTTNAMASDVYLLVGRAYHTATVLGDGRVVVEGGFNGVDGSPTLASPSDPTDPNHNYGYLDVTEIFDPLNDSMSFGPQAKARRMQHSATLLADGGLDIHGGLGNIPPTPTVITAQADSGSLYLGTGSTSTISLTQNGLPYVAIQLPIAASGTIISGYIDWAGSGGATNASVTFASGTASVTVAPTSLNGLTVGCYQGQCGIILVPAPVPINTTTQSFSPTQTPYSSPVDLSQYNGTFTSSATVIIQQMVLGVDESYAEAANTQSFGSYVVDGSYAQTATLTTSGDIIYAGGLGCMNTACPPTTLLESSGNRVDDYKVLHDNDFSSSSSQLGNGIAYHTATLLPNGNILVAGGETAASQPVSAAAVISPAQGTITVTGPMSVNRSHHSATLLDNGRVLVAGGFTNSSSTEPTNTADIYYPNPGVFVPTAPMNVPRVNHTATLMPDGSVIVVGGETTGGAYTNSVEVYSSTSVAWTNLAPLPIGLAAHTATLLKDGRLLILGGQTTSGASNLTYAYSPAANSWTALAPMPKNLYGHTATSMSDGRVLLVGGDTGVSISSRTFLFDPSAPPLEAWTDSGVLTYARMNHTATVLPNDTVIVTGGMDATMPPAAEIYHLDGSTWAPISPFPPRAAQTATLALDGKVYVIGGYSGSTYYNTAIAGDFSALPDAETSGAPPSLRQSSITAITAYPFMPGGNFTAAGNTFEGGTEASGGGAATQNSSFSFPHLVLQQFGGSGGSSAQSDGGFLVDLTTQVYLNPSNASTLNTSLTVPTPSAPGLPYGWYQARVGANDIYSKALAFQVGPALPTSAPGSITGFAMGTSSISWTWSAVAGSIGGYNIYQSSSLVFIGTAPVAGTPAFVQGGLQPNTTGSIVVAAYTLSGDGPLAYSATNYTLAAPPTAVTLSSVTPNSILVQWNVNNNAPGTVFEIDESTDGFVSSFSTPVPASLLVTTNSYDVGGLVPGTTYYFRMQAYNGNGLPSGFSTPIVSTQTTTGVSGVAGVALSPSSIQWSWPAAPGAISYDIFVATSGQLAGTSTTTIFTDNGLAIDSARSVLVGAVTSAGLGPLTASTTIYTLTNPPSLASPVYTQVSTGGFVVNWNNNSNPPGITYDVNIYSSLPSTGAFVSTIDVTGALYAAVANLAPSRDAVAVIYAINGNGILSAPLILPSTVTFANPPINLAITANTSNAISVAWSDNSNSTTTYYQVTYSTDDFVSNLSTAVPFASGGDLSSTTISGLLTSTTYWIVVQAENRLGVLTSYSNTVSTITFNGGAAPGLLSGILPASTTGQISGTLGNGQFVNLASPAGAFPTNTTVTISSYNVVGSLCPGAVNIGVAINDAPPYMPLRALDLTLAYTVAQLGALAPGQAIVMRYVPSSGVCVPLNTTLNALALTLTAEINDFGIFVVAAPQSFGSAATARAYPNPYHVNRDGYVTIDQIPPGSRVRVMDLRGDTVLDQTANAAGLVTWSASNGSGRQVASGVYLVLIQGGGTQKILKLAVIR